MFLLAGLTTLMILLLVLKDMHATSWIMKGKNEVILYFKNCLTYYLHKIVQNSKEN